MAHLRSLVNEMRENLGNHAKDTEKVQQSLKKPQQKADEIISEVERKETEVSDRIARLEETVRAEQQSRRKFQNQVEQMQEQLNETQSDLLKIKGDLHTGQTAYSFEKHLAAYLYPPETPVTHGRIFTTLMKWLKTHRFTHEGREANKKWEKLKEEFGWSSDKQQTAVFFKMIKCREEYAHPEVNFALPIPEIFTSSEKKCVQVIRNMTIKLNEQVNQHDV